jgi:hypothetical protein
VHPSSALSALFDQPIRGHRHIPQGYGCDHFVRDGIMLMSAQPDLNISFVVFGFNGRRLMDALAHMDNTASFALMIRDSAPTGRVWRDAFGVPAVSYTMPGDAVRRMHRAMVVAGEMSLAAGAKRLYPMVHGELGSVEAKDWRRFTEAPLTASDMVWTSYHPLGTCKMGHDRRTSVVGTDHETHDVPGLFVVDGSTVPGPLGVNPQVTIMAMATRAAEKIADKL